MKHYNNSGAVEVEEISKNKKGEMS